jgi:copper(I)-binding protein
MNIAVAGAILLQVWLGAAIPGMGFAIVADARAAAQPTEAHKSPYDTKSYTVGDLMVARPWSRPTPGGAKVVAGYMRITNTGASPDRLVGGSSPIAGRFEIHASALSDGVMRMRRLVDGIEIPPGETVIFEPGGKHLMLGDLTAAVQEGEPFAATLIFEKAGPVTVEFSVGSPAEKGDAAPP